MERIRGILAALALLLAGNASASKLLVLPVMAEGVEAERAARVQAAVLEATSTLAGIERMVPKGPTFCTPTDTACIGAAGRDAGADRVLHTTLRPLGESVSLLLLVVGADGKPIGKQVETLQPSQAIDRMVRERVIGLLAPALHVGALWVDAPEGSAVYVNGEPKGTTPLSDPIGGLAPGQHLLRVVRGGAAEARSYVEIRYASVTRVRIEPRSDQVALQGFDELSEPGANQGHAVSRPDGTGPVATPGRALWQLPETRWSLLAGGGLALAGGWAASVDGKALRDARTGLRDDRGRFSQAQLSKEASLRSSYERRQGWAVGLFAAGGILAAGAGTLFLLDLLEPADAAPVDVGWVATPGGMGIAGTF